MVGAVQCVPAPPSQADMDVLRTQGEPCNGEPCGPGGGGLLNRTPICPQHTSHNLLRGEKCCLTGSFIFNKLYKTEGVSQFVVIFFIEGLFRATVF